MTAAPRDSGHWAGVAEVGSAFGMSFLYWVYRLFGRVPFRLVLIPVALYFFCFKARQRAASLEFLARCHALDPQCPRPSAYNSFRHFLSFGEAMLDKLVAWNGGLGFQDVTFEGYDPVRAAMDAGRGALLIGSHLGNLEVCRVLSQQRKGLRLRVLVHTRHAQNFNRMMQRLNPQSHVSLQQVTELGVAEAAELSAWVESGGFVLIAGDRVPVPNAAGVRAERVTHAPFLGHSAPFPMGPWLLANVLGCPVFSLFCVRMGGRFRARFEMLGDRVELPRKAREQALQSWVLRFAQRLEREALLSPLQWFNFFPFWASPVGHPAAGQAESEKAET